MRYLWKININSLKNAARRYRRNGRYSNRHMHENFTFLQDKIFKSKYELNKCITILGKARKRRHHRGRYHRSGHFREKGFEF